MTGGKMRSATLVLVIALGLAFMPGCAPRFPNDLDHRGDGETSLHCPECHFGGEAVQAPSSHGDGAGNVSWEYESCLSCHRST
jgi:hypothetical protein